MAMKTMLSLLFLLLLISCDKEEPKILGNTYVGTAVLFEEKIEIIYDDHGEVVDYEIYKSTIETTNDTLWITCLEGDQVIIGSTMPLFNFAWADTIVNDNPDSLFFKHDGWDIEKNLTIFGVGDDMIEAVGRRFDRDHNQPHIVNRIEFSGERK